MMENIFLNMGIIFIVAAIFGFIAKKLNQPKIPFYIFAGFVVGPFGLMLAEKLGLVSLFLSWFAVDISGIFVSDPSIIKILAEIGIAFLLFVVGLELNLKKLKDIGMIATLGGSLQVLILFTIGSIFALGMGFLHIEAIYIGLILAFSSTVVVVKLLVDNKELNTLHGRIVIGILLMQDVIAVLVLSMLATFNTFSAGVLLFALFKIVAVLIVSVFLSKFIFPKIFTFAAKSNEVLFLVSLAVCFFFSLLLMSLGFSIAIGAFIAGITLANLPYNIAIVGRVKSIRDFFATLFFVSLGMEFFLEPSVGILKPLIIFFLFIVVFKPIVIMLICSLFGYMKSTSFFASLSLAQISEFSLIILSQGLLLGHISQDLFSIGVMLGVITMTSTAYLINYDNQIYKWMFKLLGAFDFIKPNKEKLEYIPKEMKYDVVLVGVNRIGYSIIKSLNKIKENVLVIDYNPEIIRDFMKKKQPCFYGDIGDLETIGRLNFKDVEIIVSTVPTQSYNIMLIKKVKEQNKNALIFVTTEDINNALDLYDRGADYVILPHFLGGEYVSVLLEESAKNMNKLIVAKLKHIEELKKRKEIGHEHPKHY